MKKCIYLDPRNNELEADFYGIFQRAELYRPEPVIYGHQGGMRAWTVAIIYDGEGVHEIDPLNIKKIYEISELDQINNDRDSLKKSLQILSQKIKSMGEEE